MIEISDQDGFRWVSCKLGYPVPAADVQDLKQQKLALALLALRDALSELGAAPVNGPIRGALVLPDGVFDVVRDALVADGAFGAGMFKRPRRRTVDRSLRRTMLSGVAIVTASAVTLDEMVAPACPARSAKVAPLPSTGWVPF